MKTKLRLSGILILAIVVILASGCAVNQENRATITPVSVIEGSVFEFITYADPAAQFKIAAPKDAKVTISKDGLLTTFDYEDDSIIHGMYILSVEVMPDISARSPGELLEQVTAQEQDDSEMQEVQINDGKDVAVFYSFETAPGEHCSKPHSLIMAALINETGYLVRISSDAEERCNAEKLPETLPVLQSIDFPSETLTQQHK